MGIAANGRIIIMNAISINDVIKYTEGTLVYGGKEESDKVMVISVSSNSREIEPGALFVPIIGEKVDAHIYIEGAIKLGAVAAIASKDVQTDKLPDNVYIIKVDDTLRAIQRLAAWYRRKFDIPVIGVTGSVGKTTTKEMIAAALSAGKRVLKTIGNRNSQLGVALMMFELSDDYDIAVIEMGISEPDEMYHLTHMAAPQTAVVTNIGVSHIAMLGSRENIRREKLDIIRGFEGSGTLYICGDDVLLSELAKSNISDNIYDMLTQDAAGIFMASKVYTYGSGDNCDYKATGITPSERGISFTYKDRLVNLGVDGLHNAANAAAALALAEKYGVDIEASIKELEAYRPLSMRGQVTVHKGITVIDDTYNASPDSMRSALGVLWLRQCKGRRVAVLADALELGDMSESLHREVGRYIASEYDKGNVTDCLVTVGKMAACLADETKKQLSESEKMEIVSYDNREEAAEYLKNKLTDGDTVILKGSRGMKLDEVVSRLLEI